MRERTSEAILISKESWIYLRQESRKKRGCSELTSDQLEKQWGRIEKVNSMKLCDDLSFGGGDGNYYGKWTSWSVDTLKTMLDEKGLYWEHYGEQTYIIV